ncbi:MAG: hypothetical protein IKR13_01140 [Victivallales bacterium]|nr:hypothetical protein [Victivallales bacterium]
MGKAPLALSHRENGMRRHQAASAYRGYFDLLAALAIAAMAVPAAASPAQVMVMIILISSYAMGWLLMLRPPGRLRHRGPSSDATI